MQLCDIAQMNFIFTYWIHKSVRGRVSALCQGGAATFQCTGSLYCDVHMAVSLHGSGLVLARILSHASDIWPYRDGDIKEELSVWPHRDIDLDSLLWYLVLS